MVTFLQKIVDGPNIWSISNLDNAPFGVLKLDLEDATHKISIVAAYFAPDLERRVVKAEIEHSRANPIDALRVLQDFSLTVVSVADRIGFDPLVYGQLGVRPTVRLDVDALGPFNRPYTLQATFGIVGVESIGKSGEVIEVFVPHYWFNLNVDYSTYLGFLHTLGQITGLRR